MINRIIGVFRLSPETFDEIKRSETALGQAAIIVLAIALLSAFRNGFLANAGGIRFLTGYSLTTLVWSFVSWPLWAGIANFVGATVFGGKARLQGMLRVIGFAFAPRMLLAIPCAGWLIGLIWSLVAGFFAVRQCLELDDLKAALTTLISFGIYITGSLVLGFLFGRTFPFAGY